MTINQMKGKILAICKNFWKGATVIWSEAQVGTKPSLPFVRLRIGGIRRTYHDIVEEDSIDVAYVPSEATLTVELFSEGKVHDTQSGGYYENTAVEDLSEFVNYLLSPNGTEMLCGYDLAIIPLENVQNTTQLLDNDYEYRAYVDLTVRFTQDLHGANHVVGLSASGGGSQAMADENVGWIDEDKINIESEVS